MTNDRTDTRPKGSNGRYKNIKDKWYFLLFIFIAGNLFHALIVNRILPPKLPSPNVNITYNFLETIPKQPDFSGDLRVDYESDQNITGLQIYVHNNGDKNAKNLEFKICTINDETQLEPATIIFDPTTLNEHIVKSKNYNEGFNGFYRKLDVFHSESTIYIEIWPKKNIAENDIKFEFASELKKWIPKRGKIEYKLSKSIFSLLDKSLYVNEAYAEDVTKKEAIESNSSGKSGVLIGGYDPLVMATKLFITLQKEKLITRNEARKIIETLEGEQKLVLFGGKPALFGKEKVLFGGINVLKFNELMLNALIKNKKISKKEAVDIIEKSKKPSGIMISGYNVIVLDIEIMNTLIRNDFLDLKTAQSVVDSPKRRILTEDGKPLFLME